MGVVSREFKEIYISSRWFEVNKRHRYWDYSLDVAPGVDLLGSPIFSPTTGFGGDGNPGNDHCVCSGSPFSHWTIHVEGSRGLERNDHCLSRKLNPMIGYQWLRRGRGSIDEILGQPDFGSMWKLLEAEPSFENFIIGGSVS